MIRRATPEDIETINEWISRDFGDQVDLGAFLNNPMNVILLEGAGGAAFVWRGPGIFEVHVFFEQRGRAVLDLTHRMFAVMRHHFGARMFWAAIPLMGRGATVEEQRKDSRKTQMYARLMGWRWSGTAELPHGQCEIFVGT